MRTDYNHNHNTQKTNSKIFGFDLVIFSAVVVVVFVVIIVAIIVGGGGGVVVVGGGGDGMSDGDDVG